MKKTYDHLSYDEKVLIEHHYNTEQCGFREIGRKLKRSHTTIKREIARNLDSMGYYRASHAQEKYEIRREFKAKFEYYKIPDELTNAFASIFDKKFTGVKTTLEKLKSENLNVKIPCFLQSLDE